VAERTPPWTGRGADRAADLPRRVVEGRAQGALRGPREHRVDGQVRGHLERGLPGRVRMRDLRGWR